MLTLEGRRCHGPHPALRALTTLDHPKHHHRPRRRPIAGLHHPAAQAYLQRLDAASAVLTPERRAGLRAEVEEHLTEAIARTDGSGAALTRVLDELGSPDHLVAEVGGDAGPAPTVPGAGGGGEAPTTDRPRLEVVTVTVLVASIVCCASIVLLPVAVAPWLVGSVLVLFSAHWSAGDKALALIAYGILGAPLLIVAIPLIGGAWWSETCSGRPRPDVGWQACSAGPAPWWWVLVAAGAIALTAIWVAVGIRLVRSMRRPVDHRRILRMG